MDVEQVSLFPLTEEELQARGAELARLCGAYDRVETEKKIATRELTAQLKDLRGQISALARVVEHRQEYRDLYDQALRRTRGDGGRAAE